MTRSGISEAQADALAATRSPYLGGHLGTIAGRVNGYRPRGLVALLRWYERECWACVPTDLHKRELWHEYVKVTDDAGSYAKQGGGPVRGAPASHDASRHLLRPPP